MESTRSISPEVFVSSWDGARVLLPEERTRSKKIVPKALDFLVRGGLPASLVYGYAKGPGYLSFSILCAGLLPVMDLLPSSTTAPASWPEHYVLGDEWFEGGASPLWCLHGPTGRVESIDLESDTDEARLVNTTVDALATTLVALRSWALGGPARSLDQLRRALEEADPTGWDAGQWRLLLDYLDSIGANGADLICEPGLNERPLRPVKPVAATTKWRWTINLVLPPGAATVNVVLGDPRALEGRPLRCIETGTSYELTGIALQKPFEYEASLYLVTLRCLAGTFDLQPGMTLVAGDD